jgi:hypothetical protein
MNPLTSIYQSALGDKFEELPVELKRFHGTLGYHTFEGSCVIEGPKTWAARLLAKMLHLPEASAEAPLLFHLQMARTWEQWERHFPGRVMRSVLEHNGEFLVEALGPSRLFFLPVFADGRLSLNLKHMTFCGIPCPRWLFPRVKADETGSGGVLHFDVAAAVPLIGQLVAYKGYLNVASSGDDDGHRV